MYYVTNELSVNKNEQRLLRISEDWKIFAASQTDTYNCFLIYGYTNGDPVYFGWYCPETEYGEMYEDVYLEYDGLPFNFDDLLLEVKSHSEDVKQYEEQSIEHGFLTNVECFNQTTGEDIVIDIKLKEEAYPSKRNGDFIEYESTGIASNGETCLVSWNIPANMDDVSYFDWDDVCGVDFRY